MDGTSINQVLATNCRHLRGEHTLEETAKACRLVGLKWTTGRISELERGKVSATFGTLVLLAMAYGALTDRTLRISDLLTSEDPVELTPTRVISGSALNRFAAGEPVALTVRDVPGGADRIRTAMTELSKVLRAAPKRWQDAPLPEDPDLTEERAASKLGVPPLHVSMAAMYLWGHSVTAERDARTGEGATAQKRGHVTRQLIDELRTEFDRGDD